MYTHRFQAYITTGRFTLPITILLSIICWIFSILFIPTLQSASNDYLLWNLLYETCIPAWGQYLFSFLLYALIGYILVELNNIFAIIRMRASVQTAVFFLLVSICPALYPLTAGQLSGVIMLCAIYFLFRSYQQSPASANLFYTFFCIGMGSLLFPKLTLLAPLLWIGAYSFQSLHIKSFLASLIGWGLPYWLLWAHAYFYGQMDLFYAPFLELIHLQPIEFTFSHQQTAFLTYVFILFIVSASHCIVAGYEDKIRTRSYLQFLIFFNLCLFVFMILQPNTCIQFLPILLIGVSILAGHFFTLTNSRSSNCFFIGMLLILGTLFGFNIWTLL